jgi:transcriptional regulator with XRE-family HTH domain
LCADKAPRVALQPESSRSASAERGRQRAYLEREMSDVAEIREFLTSRRAKLSPQHAGLPMYGAHRRVSGLRREEVALLAGISVEYYTRLERGNVRGASEDVLNGIVRALRLDDAESAHLFDLVRAASASALRPSRRGSAPERVRPSVKRIVDAMPGIPALVVRLPSRKRTVPIDSDTRARCWQSLIHWR